MAHTPGPWEAVCIDGIGWGVFGPRDDCGAKQPIYSPDLPLNYANATLIAAVPLLLEACEAALDALDEYTSWQEAARVKLRAAIAAAREGR